MINNMVELIAVAADWPWLEPLGLVTKATAGVISLGIAVHRAIRYALKSGDSKQDPP